MINPTRIPEAQAAVISATPTILTLVITIRFFGMLMYVDVSEAKRQKQIEESIQRYLNALETADRTQLA